MENNRSKFRFKEKMLVIVNNDWNRTYVASIKTIYVPDGTIKYTAKCQLKDFSILTSAHSKIGLSNRMDDLATIIEEYTSPKLPFGIPLVADIICCLN